jgi:SAM-dependent methyltransferase
LRHPPQVDALSKGSQTVVSYQQVPWQLKIAAKLILARVPVNHRKLNRVGVFNMGGMERPEYAWGVFRRHFDRAAFARKNESFVTLELGPGDSLFSALIARSFGASVSYAVDVAQIASPDVSRYREMESYLRKAGMNPPGLNQCASVDEVMKVCGGKYLTKGLESLKQIPTASVDFVWSHTVLQHVRRKEFLPVLQELRRIQRPDGVGSHCISISDILGGRLNDLRFSERIWESSFMANSGFYTNRIRYGQLLEMFRAAGFEPQVYRTAQWQTLPTPRRKMAPEFASLPEEDLQVSGFDVYLR